MTPASSTPAPFESPGLFSTLLRERAALLVLTAGCVLSSLAFFFVRERERNRSEVEFERRTRAFVSLATDRLQRHPETLYALRNLFHYSGKVTRQDFAGAARDLISRQVGVQALEWIERVPSARRTAFENAVRAEGFTDFTIRERASAEMVNSLRPASPRPEHFPVLYIEPYVGNEPALGFDLASGTTWPQLEKIAATGEIAASGSLPLLDRSGSPTTGYIMELPVYANPDEATTPAARRAQLRGYVFGIFNIGDLIDSFFSPSDPPALEVLFLDRGAPADKQFLHYRSGSSRLAPGTTPPTVAEISAGLHLSVSVAHAGRQWELWCRPTPEWLAQQSNVRSWLTLALGLAITGFAGTWIFANQRRSVHVERQVALRTAELRTAQQLLETDIRRREEAEQRLRDSETRLQAILQHSPAAIFVKDPAGYYILFNRPFEVLVCRTREQMLGRRDIDIFPEYYATMYGTNDRLVLDAGVPMEFEETNDSPDGLRINIVQKFPLRDATGQIYALCGIATEITARKRAEAELQESRRQLGNLLGQLPGAAFRCMFDDRMTLLFGTEGLLQLTGYAPADFLGGRVHLAQLTLPEDRPAIRKAVSTAIAGRHNFEVEYRFQHRDGREKWVLVRGRPVFTDQGGLRFLEGLAIDVTALKSAEAEKLAFERQLLETQKLESLGVLAGGIAHDFNNLLTAMLGNATLARLTLDPSHLASAHLDHIEQAARRAADLCQQMLAYAGKRPLVIRPLSVSELVRSTASLLAVSIRKNTHLTLHLAEELPAVLADHSQLQQIVMNLVINAADAIGDAPGEISIVSARREVDPAFLRTAIHKPELPGGTYVSIVVSDNGSGMSPETLARIFEPFFTTKFSGRGLGLAAVLGIVQSHRGALFVESALGRGSVFRLFLPASHEPAPAVGSPAPISAGPPALPPATTPRGSVLIVDDEEPVRNVAAAALRRLGLAPIVACDGIEALQLFASQPTPPLAVLLDLTMPGLSGEETLRRLRAQNPTLRVIVMSGFSEQDTMQRCAALGVDEFMAKPFELTTLMAKFPAR